MSPRETEGRIRRARRAEADALSALALRSKGHWGYDDAFLEACREELRVSPAQVDAGATWVFEARDGVLGFCALERDGPDRAELLALFVEPAAIGRGVGRRLLAHASEQARALGCRVLHVESDPNAEPFYRAQGGVPAGRAPSGSIAGRELPVLELALDQGKQIER